jgi:CHAD domain-containing protein
MVTEESYLFSYYKNETQAFFKGIRNLGRDFDADELHRLRVSIKRIRTIYRLLEEFSGTGFNAHKHYSSFRKIFSHAGKIREIQVNKLIILEHTNSSVKLNSYLQEADRKKKKFSSSFIKCIHQINIPELKKEVKKIKKRCKKIGDVSFLSKAQELIHSETEIIRQLRYQFDKNANIHKARKHLKALHSVVKLYYSIKPDEELKKLEVVIKETEELLGNWHDRTILLASLKKFNHSDKRQAGAIKKVILKLAKQNKVLLSASKVKIGLIFKSLPKQLC